MDLDDLDLEVLGKCNAEDTEERCKLMKGDKLTHQFDMEEVERRCMEKLKSQMNEIARRVESGAGKNVEDMNQMDYFDLFFTRNEVCPLFLNRVNNSLKENGANMASEEELAEVLIYTLELVAHNCSLSLALDP